MLKDATTGGLTTVQRTAGGQIPEPIRQSLRQMENEYRSSLAASADSTEQQPPPPLLQNDEEFNDFMRINYKRFGKEGHEGKCVATLDVNSLYPAASTLYRNGQTGGEEERGWRGWEGWF